MRISRSMGSVALVLLLCTCRKEDNFAYESIKGKWRCIFIDKSYFDTAGNGTHDTIYPDADYTLEFKKNKKLIMSKSGECVMDRKVTRCEYAPTVYIRIDFQIKRDRGYSLKFKTSDTIFIDPSFFPGSYYDLHEEDVFYTSYYVRE